MSVVEIAVIAASFAICCVVCFGAGVWAGKKSYRAARLKTGYSLSDRFDGDKLREVE